MDSTRRFMPWVIFLTLAAAGVFGAGIDWGLPSRAVDGYLFGDQAVWEGKKIHDLAPKQRDASGSDVDVNPVVDRSQPVWLNQTDAQRAEIIRRYRLFSHQPDEMITFSALQVAAGAYGDPRLYQYGGLWVYPVGVLVKVLLNPTGDAVYYLDHPEEFAKFYIVARAYSALWGIAGVWAVFFLTRRISGCSLASGFASLAYISSPVVINMAHEAKPHLAGTVLMLLAILAAIRFVEKGTLRWAVTTGALCGAAFGMILSALMIFSILPVMVMFRPVSAKERIRLLVTATLVGGAVYAITNPFVPINFIDEYLISPEFGPLKSNLGNSTAMYQVSRVGEGFVNAARLLTIGGSRAVLIGILVAIALPIIRRRVSPIGWLMGVPSVLILMQFVALAAGKPGEYARFALLPIILLLIAAVVVMAQAPRMRGLVMAAFVVLIAIDGFQYLRGFVIDSGNRNSRIASAELIAARLESGDDALGLYFEPAPFGVPPVDLFRWKIILLPRSGEPGDADLVVGPVGNIPVASPGRDPNPMSWANRPFDLRESK